MPDRNQPFHKSAEDASDELSLEDLEQASGGSDGLADDELSIDDLDIATGGTESPPPDPDAGC